MDTGLGPTLMSASPPAQDVLDAPAAATEAAALALVDLQDIIRTPEQSETNGAPSPECSEEFIVVNNSKYSSYILPSLNENNICSGAAEQDVNVTSIGRHPALHAWIPTRHLRAADRTLVAYV